MTEKALTYLDQAAAAMDSVLAGVRPEQLDAPTPCSEWSVRDVLNHVVSGNLMIVSTINGEAPADRETDHLGDDPLGAFRSSAASVRAAFSTEGVMARTFTMPWGEQPAEGLATVRAGDTAIHAWDLAKATGQTVDLDPDLTEACITLFRAMLPPDRTGMPFSDEQPVPADASPADRLAALSGRAVS